MTARYAVDLLLQADHDLAEGPQWDAPTRSLSWVDITAGTVHVIPGEGGTPVHFEIGEHVGAALPAPDGWLLATRAGFATLDREGTVGPLLTVLDDAGIRFNDAKCDPVGRAFGGTMAYAQTARAGALYRLDDGPVARTVFEGVTISNGLGWSADGGRFWFIDSGTQSIAGFDYDLESGTVGAERVRIDVPRGDGMPDGLCVDDAGGVWVALWGGAAVHRYTPDGRLDAIVDLPVSQPTSCALGGAGGDVLYITTASYQLGRRSQAEPLAGSLFGVAVPQTGRPATPWIPVEGQTPPGARKKPS